MIEQDDTELVIGVDGGHAQGAGAVGRDIVDVRAVGEQDLGDIDMPVANGEQERA